MNANVFRHAAFSVVVATIAPLLPIPRAHAAPSAEEVTDARKHFQQGVLLFDEGDFKGALVEFKRAHQIAPNWQVLFNIGQCQYQLLDYPSAIETLDLYLKQGGDQVPAEKKARVTQDLEDLHRRVATLRITVEPAGAQVFVDDNLIGTAPLAKPIVVSTGSRRIVAKKPGYVEATKTIELAGGDSTNLELRLVPTPVEAPIEKKTNWLPYVGFGLAGVGIVVGTVFGGLALSKRSDLESVCKNKKCPEGSQPNVDALSRDATISTIGFGAAIVGIGIGVYGVLSDPNRNTAPKSGSITPFVGFGIAGVNGAF